MEVSVGARACKQGDSVFASRRVAFASAGSGALLPGSAAAPIRTARGPRLTAHCSQRGPSPSSVAHLGSFPLRSLTRVGFILAKAGEESRRTLVFPTLESREMITCEKQTVSVGPSLHTGIPSPSLSLRTGPGTVRGSCVCHGLCGVSDVTSVESFQEDLSAGGGGAGPLRSLGGAGGCSRWKEKLLALVCRELGPRR